ncbi:MAG TPA: hypothetical protein VFI23_03995 [Rhizomicrobium sp.]|nr:hypothetical protein [Rhizomicrobium sp.]
MHADTVQNFKSRALAALRHELRDYVVISLYLYLYFVALILYKDSVLKEYGIGYAPWGLAVVKALVLGKFILLGESMRLGHRSRGKPLIWFVLRKVAAFVAFLFVLSYLEEVTLSLLHHHSLHDALAILSAETWQRIAAMSLLGCLALTPFFGLQEMARAMGTQNFRRMMFERRS